MYVQALCIYNVARTNLLQDYMPANIKQDNRYNPKAKFSIQPAGTSGEVHGHKWQV